METTIYIIILTMFCIFLYIRFGRKPKIKTVKVPDKKSILKQKRKNRRIKKFKRFFRTQYKGKSEIIPYDKQHGYFDSAWNEIQKPKK